MARELAMALVEVTAMTEWKVCLGLGNCGGSGSGSGNGSGSGYGLGNGSGSGSDRCSSRGEVTDD